MLARIELKVKVGASDVREAERRRCRSKLINRSTAAEQLHLTMCHGMIHLSHNTLALRASETELPA